MPLPQFQPLPLSRARATFCDPEWLFELKWDGFRSLLYSDRDGVRLVSCNGNIFKSFPGLCEGLARDLKGRRCVLDGEIVCLDSQGRPQFRDLLFRRAEPVFYAFDILWDEHAWSDDVFSTVDATIACKRGSWQQSANLSQGQPSLKTDFRNPLTDVLTA